MSGKRMFSLDVVDTDKFLDMPTSTQVLYFHLGMRADDYGFVASPKRITKAVGCNEDDLKLLIAKSYLIPFDDGVVVISDWNVNNWIRQDRKKSTRFDDKLTELELKNGVYILSDTAQPIGSQLTDNGQTADNQKATECQPQYSIDKYSIDKYKKHCASDNAQSDSKAEINAFFESVWKLYPSKKGKGQISDAKKKALYKIGYEELSRAIERYKAGLAKDDWRKPQNGSTFFNSGYVDYLDANYTEDAAVTEEGQNGSYKDYVDGYLGKLLPEDYEPVDGPFK